MKARESIRDLVDTFIKMLEVLEKEHQTFLYDAALEDQDAFNSFAALEKDGHDTCFLGLNEEDCTIHLSFFVDTFFADNIKIFRTLQGIYPDLVLDSDYTINKDGYFRYVRSIKELEEVTSECIAAYEKEVEKTEANKKKDNFGFTNELRPKDAIVH